MFLHVFRSSQITRQRYATAVDSIKRELALAETPDNDKFIKAAKDALERAEESKKDSIDSWHYIHEAQIYSLISLSPAARRARTTSLLVEIAEKIPAWRQKQTKALIGTPEKPKEDATAEDVAEAMRIRNDYFNTQFTRIAYRRCNLNLLGVLLISILIIILVGLLLSRYCVNIYNPGIVCTQVLAALAFGALGACLSMAYTLTATPVTAKIPEHLMSSFIVFARISIGGACALVALMLLHSDMLDNILSNKVHNKISGLIVVAFTAGFSERWIMRTIDKISNGSQGKDK